jgi:hypothetical protein
MHVFNIPPVFVACSSETKLMSLKGKTLFISGGSRGIGKAIALRAAKDGANVVIAAKTTEEHPKVYKHRHRCKKMKINKTNFIFILFYFNSYLEQFIQQQKKLNWLEVKL